VFSACQSASEIFFLVFCHRQYCCCRHCQQLRLLIFTSAAAGYASKSICCCCRHCQQLRLLIFTSAAAGYASKSICFFVCLSVRKQDNSKTCNIFSCHIILTVMFSSMLVSLFICKEDYVKTAQFSQNLVERATKETIRFWQ